MIRVWFTRSHDVGGFLIRLLTLSKWNHVALEIGGTVYEAMAGGGVRAVPAKGYAESWAAAKCVEVAVDNPAPIRDWLRGQIGKRYDWAALLALPFRASWQHPRRWFCSELVAQALHLAGAVDLPKAYRITPGRLWRVVG